MANKTLSVFIDESGDFGKFDPKSPFYYVSMVLHDQSIDISSEIESLEQRVSHYGFPHHARLFKSTKTVINISCQSPKHNVKYTLAYKNMYLN